MNSSQANAPSTTTVFKSSYQTEFTQADIGDLADGYSVDEFVDCTWGFNMPDGVFRSCGAATPKEAADLAREHSRSKGLVDVGYEEWANKKQRVLLLDPKLSDGSAKAHHIFDGNFQSKCTLGLTIREWCVEHGTPGETIGIELREMTNREIAALPEL